MTELPRIVRSKLEGQSPKPLGDHPDADLLTAFAEGRLPDRERAPVLAHLAQCGHCRQVLAFALPQLEPAAVLGHSLARKRTVRWGAIRWGTLAATVAVVAIAILLRSPEPSRRHGDEMAIAPPPAATSPAKVGPAQANETQENKVAPAKPPARPAKPSAHSAELRRSKDRDKQNAEIAAASPSRQNQPDSFGGYSKFSSQPPPASVPLGQAEDSVTAPATIGQAPQNADAAQKHAASEIAPPPASAKAAAPLIAKAEKEKTAPPTAPSMAGGVSGGAIAYSRAPFARTANLPAAMPLRWTISETGALQRSQDNGRTWRGVPIAPSIKFRAVTALGNQVWVGGSGGALYHSSDAGAHWERVTVAPDLRADIVRLDFPDTQHGTLTTSDGQKWTTGDGGASWKLQE